MHTVCEHGLRPMFVPQPTCISCASVSSVFPTPYKHPSIHPSFLLLPRHLSIFLFRCNPLSFFLFRRREPKTNLGLARQKVPGALPAETLETVIHTPAHRHSWGAGGVGGGRRVISLLFISSLLGLWFLLIIIRQLPPLSPWGLLSL